MRPQYHLRNSDRGLLAWDVRKLVELTRDISPVEIPLSAISELDERFWYDLEGDSATCRSVAQHARMIGNADLTYPIIVDPQGRVMDGMHRVCKALIVGLETIQARQLAELPDPDFIGISPRDLPYETLTAASCAPPKGPESHPRNPRT